jgi:hypothetical protein
VLGAVIIKVKAKAKGLFGHDINLLDCTANQRKVKEIAKNDI